MSDLIVRPRMLKSGKMVYEYAFEIARIDGKRKRKTKSGFRTKREAKEAGKIELSLYEKCGQTTKDTNIYHSNTWYGCIKCHHWSIDRKYHDSSVCDQSDIRFYTVYHWKIED